ncbi:HupE/UreJ family protein [Roseibium sp. SCPC15]|uniref:HupE/UreJ family protein n=1 Tax=Roseibium sp. SCP15 TaxID=3141376 RepID=UPI00333B729E
MQDGLELYVRMSMPYVVAGLVGPVQPDGLPAPAPYTINRMEDGKLVHILDRPAFQQSPNGLGEIAAKGLHLKTLDTNLPLEVLDTRLHRIGSQPDFATLEEARNAFDGNPVQVSPEEKLYVGDAVIDIRLRGYSGSPIYSYQLSSGLDPGLPDQERTANLLLDYGPGGTKIFRSQGLMETPITVTRSSFAAVLTFLKEGIRHILEGLDHVLFVLCLVIGARTLSSLAWRVTGFTIGHSITLTAGFFGFVPRGSWFIPAVESAIALSIIYAAFIAIWPRQADRGGEWSMVLITGAIGLLHGLGFSFVLKNILQVTSPDIWQSLLAFNVGVEVGQLAIVLCVWPLLWLIARTSNGSAVLIRSVIAIACAGLATYWTVERLYGLALSI